jgi:5'(3')-deoxyribonucleotidase
MPKTIAVDIDGTAITQICEDWLRHLKAWYHFKHEWAYLKISHPVGILPYNLTELIAEHKCAGVTIPDGIRDGFEFFRNMHLYDEYLPRQDALEFVTRLHEEGNTILFVSKVMGDHHRSKSNWVKKWFPYADFIATSAKHHVNCDFIIDDSVPVLNKMPSNVDCIRFRADYKHEEEPTRPMKLVYNFQDAYEYIQMRSKDW